MTSGAPRPFVLLYLLKSKDQTFDAYTKFEAWSNTQLDTKIKRLRSDHGGEYKSTILVERASALLHASGLPKYLWGEALMHITWLKNRTVTHTQCGGVTSKYTQRRARNWTCRLLRGAGWASTPKAMGTGCIYPIPGEWPSNAASHLTWWR